MKETIKPTIYKGFWTKVKKQAIEENKTAFQLTKDLAKTEEGFNKFVESFKKKRKKNGFNFQI